MVDTPVVRNALALAGALIAVSAHPVAAAELRPAPADPVSLASLLKGAGGAALRAGPRSAEEASLRDALDDLLDSWPLAPSRVGAVVMDLETGEEVYAHNPDALLNPASNVKLFTSAAALMLLGSDYRFPTELFVDGMDRRGRVQTLYLKGKGDPSLNTERLYGIVAQLVQRGLTEVRGDLVIDESWFGGGRIAPGFDQEDSDRPYMAPTGAASLNWNAVGVFLRPGQRVGWRGKVAVEPPSDYFVIDSSLRTSRSRYRRYTVRSLAAGEKQRIEVRGRVPYGGRTFSTWKKVDNPPMYLGHTLKQLLAQRGVRVRGEVRVAEVPEEAKLFHVAHSATLDIILKQLNKTSSNFVAEQLVKTLGAEKVGVPGTFEKGIAAIEDFLHHEVGLPRGSYVMKNGSGLNDTNRFSARQIAHVLSFMQRRYPMSPEYLSSLGIAAKDGTLRYRFEDSDAEGRLRAKTGTLSNVSALSGYVQSVGGRRFVLSVVVNDYPGRARHTIRGIDAIGASVASVGSRLGPGPAAVAMMDERREPATHAEARARIETYLKIAEREDPRSLKFLRTAWRNEGDPAVRVVLAEAMYRSAPGNDMAERTLLQSMDWSEDTYPRLLKLARAMSIPLPGVSPTAELAARGSREAQERLVELARHATSDARMTRVLSASVVEVAREAPGELLDALRSAALPARGPAVRLLARGLADADDAEHPFWEVLRRAKGSVDDERALFARTLDETLAQRIAYLRAPVLATPEPSELTDTSDDGVAATAEAPPSG